MNKSKQKKHQAFLDDINAVYKKHGLMYEIHQPEPVVRIVEMPAEETGEQKG